jgi:Fe2+ or Zn2+ uptake regulation protein
LSAGARSSIETFEQYGETYEDDKRRETIYRELENLVEAELVVKEYDETDGKIAYSLRHNQLLFDCRAGTIEPHNEE